MNTFEDQIIDEVEHHLADGASLSKLPFDQIASVIQGDNVDSKLKTNFLEFIIQRFKKC